MISNTQLAQKFENTFRSEPTLISRAPGRINLIGEHTDYNGGFVLPAAIEYDIRMAARLNTGSHTRLRSLNYDQSFEHAAQGNLPRPAVIEWHSYWLGVVDQFKRRGFTPPALDIAIYGDVPLGAGLSSSAAFEVCAATLLNDICHANLSPKEIALLSQAAEHSDFVGVRCGIMDQFASALGADAGALFLDCHTLNYKIVPFDPDAAAIMIINTNKPRELRSSDYNQRRTECEQGLHLLNQLEDSQYPTLRHIPQDVFDRHAASLPNNIRRRVKHNLTENQRVQTFVEALESGDWFTAGQTLYESHESLRDDFEVSCRQLDAIVEITRESNLAYGCRMTGAGFGGCAVAIIAPENTDKFTDHLIPAYKDKTGIEPTIYTTKPVQGANITPLEDALRNAG